MSDLASRIAALSAAKRDLLARRLEAGGRRPEAGALAPLASGLRPLGPAPLSLAQERLWFLDQLQPGSVAYNISEAMRLKGSLDLQILQKALEGLVARHEALRTTFHSAEGKPVQVVGPAGPFDLPVVDLSGRQEPERERDARRLAAEEARRPFDLSRGPLLRARMLRFGAQDHILLLTMHHIITDGWSVAVLLMDLSALYGALAAGEEPALPALPAQYADFALWQRAQLEGEVLDGQLAYWREQLRGSPPVLELPYDRPRRPAPALRAAEHRALWPHELSERLAAIGLRAGATRFMTLFAAFTVLLHRTTGQDDILVGTPIAGRTAVETEGMVGFFVNTLALRTDLRGNPSFLELLGRVRATALAAYDHQDLPFDRLVAEVQPHRDLSGMALLQAMFGYQQAPGPLLALPGVASSTMPVHTGTAKCELSFELLGTPDGLAVRIEYCTDLFDADTVARMCEHYRVLLEGIVADPGARVGELPLLTEGERRRLLVEWNGAATDYLEGPSVGAVFESWAARTPDAVAATAARGHRLSYGELNARANRLAHRLRKLGVGRDVLVGVCVERSLAMAVAFLGILKAGGAYVPLDPHYPAARLAWMLEETRAPVVLTQEHLRGSLPEGEAQVLLLDADWGAIATESAENPPGSAEPDDLAYVIYTSGSTGRPKGVAVPHRAILRLVVRTDYVELGPSDVVAQASNISFDAATFEIWGPLLHGARFAVIPSDVLLSPRDLAAEIEREGVTTLFVTTALFHQIADEFPQAFRSLRCLLFGGEASDPTAVARVLATAPPQRLLHVYGPTEATTFATWHLVDRLAEGAATVPIGRPIANTRVLLLDRYQNLVPVGVAGELHIGGPGLARGYLGQPELTATRFLRDPLSPGDGARLYRTGDVARHLPDGSIEFLGRLDEQVKIRGFRVEPGEVETVLRKHPAVADAVVIAREDVPGEKRLVAYLVAGNGPLPPATEMRSFLSGELPAYMLPSAFVTLDRLPLTPNGKVDRRALPAPDAAAAAQGTARPGPRGMLERELAKVWQDVLGVPSVGVDESFFDLGGHSLLAIRLLARIERTFGRKLSVAALFQAPTVERLAAVLHEQGWSEVPVPAVPLGTGGPGLPFFCVPPMDPFSLLHLARRMISDRPFYALHPLGCADPENPRIEVQALAARYVQEVRAIQPDGPCLLGGMCAGGVVAFEMAQQLRQEGRQVALLALLDAWYPARGLAGRISGLGGRLAYHLRVLARLGPRKGLAHALDRLRALRRRLLARPAEGDDAASEAELVERYWLPFRAAYVRALRRYVPKPYAGRLILCIGLDTSQDLFSDRRLAWRKLALGGVDVYRAPGDHITMLREPCVRDLAELLNAHLAVAQAAAGGPGASPKAEETKS